MVLRKHFPCDIYGVLSLFLCHTLLSMRHMESRLTIWSEQLVFRMFAISSLVRYKVDRRSYQQYKYVYFFALLYHTSLSKHRMR